MTASYREHHDRARDRSLLLFLLAALLAITLYAGAYIVTCTKVMRQEFVIAASLGVSGDGPPEFTAHYSLPTGLESAATQRTCQRLFSPLYAADRYIRPVYWSEPDIDKARQLKTLEEYAKRTHGTPVSAHP